MYITFPDEQSAQELGSKLVQERLAACVNIYPGLKSIYHWQGQICSETEALMLAKTSSKLVEKLMARVAELHSYEYPAMLSLRVEEAYKPYESWLKVELET